MATEKDIYYELSMYINTDGDYGYERTQYEVNPGENVLYFKNLQDAIDVLTEHFRSVIDTVWSHRDLVEDVKLGYSEMLSSLENDWYYVEAYGELNIEHDFGNPMSRYSIRKVERIQEDNYFYYRPYSED